MKFIYEATCTVCSIHKSLSAQAHCLFLYRLLSLQKPLPGLTFIPHPYQLLSTCTQHSCLHCPILTSSDLFSHPHSPSTHTLLPSPVFFSSSLQPPPHHSAPIPVPASHPTLILMVALSPLPPSSHCLPHPHICLLWSNHTSSPDTIISPHLE